MTNAKHTPGPWALDGSGWICDATGSPVCLINAGLADHDLDPQERADARLIAAAPDLLASLKAIVPVVVNRILEPSSDQRLKDMILGAYDAIAKAEGRI